MVFKVTSNDQCGWEASKEGWSKMVITDIVPGGVADVAGIRNGDLLLKINSKEFKQQ